VFGGLEWAALGCSSSSPAPAAEQRVGRRQMLSGIGTLRGERTRGSDGRRGEGPRGGKPRGLIPGIPN